jgi:hypothetical protein
MVADREVVVSVGNKAGAQEQGELLQGCYVFYERAVLLMFRETDWATDGPILSSNDSRSLVLHNHLSIHRG